MLLAVTTIRFLSYRMDAEAPTKKSGRRCGAHNVSLGIVCMQATTRGPWLKTSKGTSSRSNRAANQRERQQKPVKISLNLSNFKKATRTEDSLKFPNVLKISTLQVLGYTG